MSIYEIVFIGVALGLDTLPVAISVGMSDVNSYQVFKFSLIIFIFHLILPIIGLYFGRLLGAYFGKLAVYLGAIILIGLGLHIIYNELKDGQWEIELSNLSFIILPLSVSVDSFTVGLGLGTFGVEIFEIAIFFGAVAFLISILGITAGDKLGAVVKRAGLIGGVILVILGFRIMIFG